MTSAAALALMLAGVVAAGAGLFLAVERPFLRLRPRLTTTAAGRPPGAPVGAVVVLAPSPKPMVLLAAAALLAPWGRATPAARAEPPGAAASPRPPPSSPQARVLETTVTRPVRLTYLFFLIALGSVGAPLNGWRSPAPLARVGPVAGGLDRGGLYRLGADHQPAGRPQGGLTRALPRERRRGRTLVSQATFHPVEN